MPLQEGKPRNVNHINFGFVLPSFCHDTLEVHGPQRNGKHELLPHGMANVDGVSTKPLEKNSGHKWVKVNTMLSYRDLYDLCRTPRLPGQSEPSRCGNTAAITQGAGKH